jgi:branched-chain amino acid aminotransferase
VATWLNSKRAEGEIAPFDLNDRGLLLGDGVFDTALVLGGRAVYAKDHLARLAGACQAIDLEIDQDRLAAAMSQAIEGVSLGVVRLTVTRGSGQRGLAPPSNAHPTVIASSAALAPDFIFKSLTLWPSSIRRNERSPSSRLKTLAYLDAVMATSEARKRGFDEPLFLNTQDRLACAATGNLFLIKDGALITPPPQEGVMPGIVRAKALALASEVGLYCCERPIETNELAGADAVFVTSSLKLVAPVTMIGDQLISTRSLLLVARLAKALNDDISREGHILPRDPGLA